jgi:hypothetical protein
VPSTTRLPLPAFHCCWCHSQQANTRLNTPPGNASRLQTGCRFVFSLLHLLSSEVLHISIAAAGEGIYI